MSRETSGADCVAACSKEDFERMVVGKQNPTTLFMQGKMQLAGDTGLASGMEPNVTVEDESRCKVISQSRVTTTF